jgi:hypothetical protein
MNEGKYLELMAKMEEKLKSINAEEEVNRKGIFKDGKTFSNLERVATQSNVRLIEISSSLMIPLEWQGILKKKLKKYKGFKLYLHHLISRYEIHIINGLIPNYSNVTTKYQEKDQGLIKVGIRPWGSDWAELQLLRCSHGLSMSAIFVYLLKADSLDFAKTVSEYLVKAGIPSIPNLDLFGEMHLENGKFFFSKVFRYHENIYS